MKKFTLGLLKTLFRRFRAHSVERRSVNPIIANAILGMHQDKRAQRAKRRFLQRMQNAPDRGTNGRIWWSREDLHRHS